MVGTTSYSRAPEPEQNGKKNKCNYITAQVLAAIVGTLLTVNVSSMNSITTMVNGALKVTANSTKANLKNELFTISDTQASLYGSLLVVAHLFGSLMSGVYQDVFGRRNSLLLSTIPQILSWFILYFSENAYWLYLHALAVGIGSAFCEHVVVSYLSEISTVELRGRLFSVSKFGYGIGSFLTFMLGNFFNWRDLALRLSLLPIVLPFYLFWLPESPIWLLSKGRDEECRESLMWLRGWTTDENIEAEYQKILAQLKQRKSETDGKSDWINFVKLLSKREFLEPFKIGLVLLLSSFLLSLRAARFYFINFLHTLGVEADKMRIMTLMGVSGVSGCVLLVMTIHKWGKRALTLWTFSASGLCVLLFAVYSTLHNKYNFNAVWMIYVLCTVFNCLGGYTLGGMPWFIISEIFPQNKLQCSFALQGGIDVYPKQPSEKFCLVLLDLERKHFFPDLCFGYTYRGFCVGISGMFGHAMVSALTATFLSLEKAMGTANLLCLYFFAGMICLVYVYKYLPETENKSLYEIEEYFKKRNKPTEEDGCKCVRDKLCPDEPNSSTLEDVYIHEKE